MDKRILLILECALLFIVLVVALVAVGVSSEKYKVPEDFVDRASEDQSSGFFMDNKIVRYPTSANVSLLNLSDKNIKIGVAPQTYEINFGNVPQNITVRKFIKLNNTYNADAKVCFIARGSIGPLIKTPEGKELVLLAHQDREVEIDFNSTEMGLYSGEMDIVIRKPRYDFVTYFMSSIGC